MLNKILVKHQRLKWMLAKYLLDQQLLSFNKINKNRLREYDLPI